MSGSSLGPNQRIRLMQSSRKIEAILGVTPQFVELEPTTARPHSFRRDGRMFTRSSISSEKSSTSSFGDSSDSLLSLPLPPKPKSGISLKVMTGGTFSPIKKTPKTPKTPKQPAPPPLIIHYQTVAKGYDPRASIISLLPNSNDESDSVLRSPLSPSNVDFRRRRMAKLARTLGENVPPELVFRDLEKGQTVNDRKQLRTSRGRSWSVGAQLSSFAPGLTRKASIMKITDETLSQTRSRSDSLAFNDYSSDRSLSRMDSRTSSISMATEASTTHNTRRKQREWSGEWNANDMDNVIRSLRDLRAK